MYRIVYSKKSLKHVQNIKTANLEKQIKELMNVLRENPFRNPPPYEKLQGELKGFYSRRINAKHRLVYQVYESEKTVKILSMWTHYEF
nr:MAG TPA: toxin-antitoxin system, toxin component, Txe/YoeB family [Caudoviricetes sp.]DAP07768.1 MAG TPA: toxin-antitoxin system, toxin component, Txe/YoeB family [Caudoviricetes sp.]